MRTIDLIRVITLLIAFVLCCVGTTQQWFRLDVAWSQGKFLEYYLYGGVYVDRPVEAYINLGACNAVAERFTAAFAMAVTACVFGFLGFMACFFIVLCSPREMLKIFYYSSLVFVCISSCASLTCFVLLTHWYNTPMCGLDISIKERGAEIRPGYGIFITSFALFLIDFIFSSVACAAFGGAEYESLDGQYYDDGTGAGSENGSELETSELKRTTHTTTQPSTNSGGTPSTELSS